MKLAVRFFFTTLLFIAFSLFFLKTPTFAQTQPQTQPINSYNAPNTNPDVPNNLHNYTQNVMIEVMSAMTCQLLGVDPTNPSTKCLGVDPKTNKIGFVENGGGAIAVMGNMISMLYTPPIHTSDYIAYLSKNFGISKKAYAATDVGDGFRGIQPLIGLWSAFRNVTYLIFILVFVIIGIAIMLRVRIDPRTVMTIQNQIPKIIIGLLLVTFSFAIAGFLIDIMYISIYLLGGLLASVDASLAANLGSIVQATNPFNAANAIGPGNGGIGNIVGSSSNTVSDIASTVFNNDLGRAFFFLIGGIAGAAVVGGKLQAALPQALSVIPLIGPLIGALITGAVSVVIGQQLAGLFAKVIALLIIGIAVLWALFRLWFVLLEAYIMILVNIVFAPFWIITGLLPGLQSAGFGAWLREMLANLAVFPTAIIILLLGKIFIDNFGTGTGHFVAPLIGSVSDMSGIGALIGLGIIFILPQAAKLTKAMFKAPKIDLGPIGQAVGVGMQAPGRVIGGGVNAWLAPHYKKNEETGQMELFLPGGVPGRLIRGFTGR